MSGFSRVRNAKGFRVRNVTGQSAFCISSCAVLYQGASCVGYVLGVSCFFIVGVLKKGKARGRSVGGRDSAANRFWRPLARSLRNRYKQLLLVQSFLILTNVSGSDSGLLVPISVCFVSSRPGFAHERHRHVHQAGGGDQERETQVRNSCSYVAVR